MNIQQTLCTILKYYGNFIKKSCFKITFSKQILGKIFDLTKRREITKNVEKLLYAYNH